MDNPESKLSPIPKPTLKPKKTKKPSAPKESPKTRPGRGALVIVESPAKCRTIEKILGSHFVVKASMGHIIDLPKSKLGIAVESDFEPKYVVMAAKRKVLMDLKKAASSRAEIFLACDPDREGEAIAYHLGQELGGGKPVRRVRFHEITPQAIRKAFEKPEEINMDKVGAQQARRVLDRLVGYSLSPLLWKAVARGLSAGRVQSVALRLIVDQERRIRDFKPEEYWTIDLVLENPRGESFEAAVVRHHGKEVQILNAQDAHEISTLLKRESPKVASVDRAEKRRLAPPPFTTSKLQQEAFNRLRMRPYRTMAVAQSLYEGVDLGGGETVGLITYMRTDSVQVSPSALEEVRQWIGKEYGAEFLPEKPNVFRSKKSAQEAHEAIRPTSVARTPESLTAALTEEALKVYTLIWNRFVASQMKPARFEQTAAEITAGPFGIKATGSRILFSGYRRVFEEAEEEADASKILPELNPGEVLNVLDLAEHQHFTKPPARYTEASLVKALEEKGIGRPSTYAPTVQTILDRLYVERLGQALMPTELGFVVTDILVKHFPQLIDEGFTAEMEGQLDEIEEGAKRWKDVVRGFYEGFSKDLSRASADIQPVRKQEEKTDEICDLCARPMVIKWGRRGKFSSCSGFPECRFSKSISTDIACPQCGKGKLVSRRAKSGRSRPFYGCTRYPECTFIANRLPGSSQDKSETPGVPAPAPAAGAQGPPPLSGGAPA